MILGRVDRSGEGVDPSIEQCSWPVLELLDMTRRLSCFFRALPRCDNVFENSCFDSGGYWALLAKSRKLAKGSDRVKYRNLEIFVSPELGH